MFPRAVRIATIRGIDVRIDPSWVILALLVVWSFWLRFRAVQDHRPFVALVMAVVAALLFFGSVLVHELAHALEARDRDITVGGITLFVFGGVTETHLEAQRPRDEFVMAAVGPYASLAAAAFFGLVATGAGVDGYGLEAVADVAGPLGWLNLALAVFNLLPGAPLDGGRVLRSAVWAISGDRNQAIRFSARAGQVLSALLLAGGLALVLLASGRLWTGLWLLIIGWFMLQAAGGELAQADLRALLRGRTVGSLLGPDPPLLPADQPLSMVLDRLAADPAHEVFPVVDEAGERVVGALRLRDVRDVDPPDRAFRNARDLALPIEQVPPIDVDAPLERLLRDHRDDEVLRVMNGNELWGLLTPREVARALHRLHELEHGPRRAPRWLADRTEEHR